MTLVPLQIPAGFQGNGTDYEHSNSWLKGSLVRWRDNSLRPVGGWQERKASFCVNPIRGMHTWEALNNTAWLAGGSYDQVVAMTGAGTTYDLTPHDLADGREDAAVGSGFGSGFYGVGYFGTPIQQSSNSVPQEATTWALENWGEYLLGCHYDDGRILQWDLDTNVGAELILTPDFATDSNWIKGAGWSIASDIASYSQQAFTFDASDALVVDLLADTITVPAHGLSDGDQVTYNVTVGETAVGGLTDGATYYIVNATANTVQLAMVSGGAAIDLTSLGTGATDELYDLRQGALEQSPTGLVVDDTYELKVTLIDPDLDANPLTVPAVRIYVTGVNTSTILVDKALVVGDNKFRFKSDDTDVKIEIYPNTSSEPAFDVDDVSLIRRPVMKPIATAPVDNLGIVVTEERFLFALGAGGNPRKVAWSDQEDNQLWTPAVTNQAGDIELQTSGQIMQGIRTRGQTLIITDTDAHTARFLGSPYVYGFERVGTSCGAVSRKSAVDVDMGVFWMGQRGFFLFDGNSVSEIQCAVHDYVFSDINTAQQSKIWAFANGQFGEIWWFYPSSASTEIDRYVAYDYKENHWMIGELSRTSGVQRGVFRYPMLAIHNEDSDIYDHEVGLNYDGALIYAETGPISIGVGEQIAKVTKVIPDEKTQGQVNIRFKSRLYPNTSRSLSQSAVQAFNLAGVPADYGSVDDEIEYGPFDPDNETNVRFSGRQIRMRVETDVNDDGDKVYSDWRVGIMRLDMVGGGRR